MRRDVEDKEEGKILKTDRKNKKERKKEIEIERQKGR